MSIPVLENHRYCMWFQIQLRDVACGGGTLSPLSDQYYILLRVLTPVVSRTLIARAPHGGLQWLGGLVHRTRGHRTRDIHWEVTSFRFSQYWRRCSIDQQPDTVLCAPQVVS